MWKVLLQPNNSKNSHCLQLRRRVSRMTSPTTTTRTTTRTRPSSLLLLHLTPKNTTSLYSSFSVNSHMSTASTATTTTATIAAPALTETEHVSLTTTTTSSPQDIAKLPSSVTICNSSNKDRGNSSSHSSNSIIQPRKMTTMGRLLIDTLLRSQLQILMMTSPTTTTTTLTRATRMTQQEPSLSSSRSPWRRVLDSSSSFPSLLLLPSTCTVATDEHANTSSLRPSYLDPNRMMVLAQPLLDSTKTAIASSSVTTTTTLPHTWMSCSTYHQQKEEVEDDNKNNKTFMKSPELSSSLSWIQQKDDEEEEPCRHVQEIREQQPPSSSSSLQQRPEQQHQQRPEQQQHHQQRPEQQQHHQPRPEQHQQQSRPLDATRTYSVTPEQEQQQRLLLSRDELIREFRKALYAQDAAWGVQVLNQATNNFVLQQQQQQQQQQQSSSSWQMPLSLSSIRDLFYLAFAQKNALASYHVMQSYIFWYQQIKHPQQQLQQQQQQAVHPQQQQQQQPTTITRNNNNNNEPNQRLLLKAELDALRKQQQQEDQEQETSLSDLNMYNREESNHNSGATRVDHPPRFSSFSLEEHRLMYRHWIEILSQLNFVRWMELPKSWQNHSPNRNYHRHSFFGIPGLQHDRYRATRMIERVVSDIMTRFELETQEYLIPKLVSSLLVQRGVPDVGGRAAYYLYHVMEQRNYKVLQQGPYLEHLLLQITYNRRRDLPFPRILQNMVLTLQYIPRDPCCVLKVLEILYPYIDLHPTHTTLQCLKVLLQREQQQQHKQQQETQNTQSDYSTTRRRIRSQSVYRVDIATLELIAASASKYGAYEINLLVWELLDLLHVPPTTAIYESTIISFAQAGVEHYGHVFAMLNEMEHVHGVIPCRALIKGLSTRFRKSTFASKRALDALLTTLQQQEQDTYSYVGGGSSNEGGEQQQQQTVGSSTPVRIAAFNAVLAGFAERGMIHDMMVVMDVLGQHCNRQKNDNYPDNNNDNDNNTNNNKIWKQLHPNADTYSMLLEGLGKHLALAMSDDPYHSRLGLHDTPKKKLTRHSSMEQQQQYNNVLLFGGQQQQEGLVEEELIQRLLRLADNYLTEMEEEWNIEPTQHIIKEYVDLLVLAGDVETATEFVVNLLEQGKHQEQQEQEKGQGVVVQSSSSSLLDLVNSKTLYRLSKANARLGNEEMAQYLIASGCCKKSADFMISKKMPPDDGDRQ